MGKEVCEALRFGLVGAGNVGWHLGVELHTCGIEFAWVYSRTETSSVSLATEIESTAYWGVNLPTERVDVLLVAVPDTIAEEVCGRFSDVARFVAHTCGSIAEPLLGQGRGGVLYPLQTFTRGQHVSLREVPCFVEASDEWFRQLLIKLGVLLRMRVYLTDAPHRRWVHLLGVLSNNFVNHLLTLSARISQEHHLDAHLHLVNPEDAPAYSPMQLLMPLLQQTLTKALALGPAEAQTGPARRGDLETLARQRVLLVDAFPEWVAVYDALTESITLLYQHAARGGGADGEE